MTTAPKQPRSTPADDKDAMNLAETTDLSPKQASDLLREHGGDNAKVKKIAETTKGES